MRWFAMWLLLVMPTLAHAQITVGDAVQQSEVEQARATLEKATPKTLTLQVGEFEVIEPAKGVTGPLLWIVSNEVNVQRIEVAANQPLGLWLKRRGETTPKLHQFPAKPFPWVILVGIKAGASTIHIIRNGATATSAPAIVDKLEVTIGGSVPPTPPTPVEDDLTQALRAALKVDQQANKADHKWVLALAGIYDAASRDSLESIKSAGELDQLLNTARQAAGIPEPDQALPTVRQRIRQELLTRLNISENGASQPLTAESRKLAKTILNNIAHSLESISQ
ncbi:MAG TPA: hypothetical protein PLN21_06025 [Gemmatales bacterium]|nr:hypothetical protein [Gemmatales bacterium]